MANQTTYTIEDIRHEMSQLRAAVNFAMAVLDGIEASRPDLTVTVEVSSVPKKDWPPCEKPPCVIGSSDLSDTGDVVRIRGRNVDNLMLALENGPDADDIEGAAYQPVSFPLALPKSGIPRVADQAEPDPNA